MFFWLKMQLLQLQSSSNSSIDARPAHVTIRIGTGRPPSFVVHPLINKSPIPSVLQKGVNDFKQAPIVFFTELGFFILLHSPTTYYCQTLFFSRKPAQVCDAAKLKKTGREKKKSGLESPVLCTAPLNTLPQPRIAADGLNMMTGNQCQTHTCTLDRTRGAKFPYLRSSVIRPRSRRGCRGKAPHMHRLW